MLLRAGVRTREGYVSEQEVRLCVRCQAHMTVEVYTSKEHACTDTTGLPEGLCPIHRKLYPLHECDAL